MRTILIESHFYAGYVVADICLWLRRGYLRPGIFFCQNVHLQRKKIRRKNVLFMVYLCFFQFSVPDVLS